MSKKIFFSGVQPSGRPHIGNYFGAMKQFVDLQSEYDGYVAIVDYHALHSLRDSKAMEQNIVNVLLDYLAIGLDPEKVTIFQQSSVSEHTELTWIFDTITTMPYLMRAHAFKDAQAKNKEIDVGTFNYPVLMASDILLYDTDIVPVGADQKQHLEITRDIAQKFNNAYGETFKLPDVLIKDEVAIVPGTDGQKMSKSYNNTIPLFAEYDEIKKCVMGIVTDSDGKFPKNVFAIHKLFRPEEEVNKIYEDNNGNYKAIKESLIEDIEEFIAPMRERRRELEKDVSRALEILRNGNKKAKAVASAKLKEVKNKIGVIVAK